MSGGVWSFSWRGVAWRGAITYRVVNARGPPFPFSFPNPSYFYFSFSCLHDAVLLPPPSLLSLSPRLVRLCVSGILYVPPCFVFLQGVFLSPFLFRKGRVCHVPRPGFLAVTGIGLRAWCVLDAEITCGIVRRLPAVSFRGMAQAVRLLWRSCSSCLVLLGCSWRLIGSGLRPPRRLGVSPLLPLASSRKHPPLVGPTIPIIILMNFKYATADIF